MLGQYTIVEKIGAGGMGQVYRAHDKRLRRDVAVKFLSPRPEHGINASARLMAEARAAAALNHPGVITIYDVGECDGQVFMVMELVAGKTMREVLASGQLDLPNALHSAIQVTEALAAAHAHGVIHADVKPENVIRQPDGRVKLLDFGIARRLARENPTATIESTTAEWDPDFAVAGTLAYMAPEQLRGTACGERVDLYAVGALLYEMVSGRPPFESQSASGLIAQILHEPPKYLCDSLSGIPSELAYIVHKLLEKDADARYQTARELIADLVRFRQRFEAGAVSRSVAAHKRTLAVLPFRLLTPSPEDEFLSVALADTVISQLSADPSLVVRPTSSVMRFAKQPHDPLLVARETNVQVVVDGSIQRSGDRLRVHIQAWNSSDGTVLVSAKHDAGMADLFALQDEISERLSAALGTRTQSEAAGSPAPPTKNARAYELYLRATERLSRQNEWDTRMSIQMLESAVAADPRFADAWARMAQACVSMAGTYEPGPRWIRRAEIAIDRALSLDHNNAEAQTARGRVLWTPARKFQHRAAIRCYGKALKLNPGTHQARIWRGMAFVHVGMLDAGFDELSRALASHPDDPFTLTFLGQCAWYQGNYEQAEELENRALRLDPAHLWANLFSPATILYMDKLEEAEVRIRAAKVLLPGDPMVTSCEALLAAKYGDSRKALRLCAEACSPRKSLMHTHHTVHNIACANAVLGKPKQALALLKKASDHGLPNYPLFRDDPHFREMKNQPEFARFLSGLKRTLRSFEDEFKRQQLT
jgi:serine/threonine-protein kinase